MSLCQHVAVNALLVDTQIKGVIKSCRVSEHIGREVGEERVRLMKIILYLVFQDKRFVYISIQLKLPEFR